MLASVVTTASIIVILLILHFTELATLKPAIFLLTALGTFAVVYLTVLELVKRFIYRKIKVIYKIIHRQKPGNLAVQSRIDQSENILEDVEQEALEYAQDQAAEIDELKRMAVYRKDFLGNVSHELKTPIFNLHGYLDTLIDGGIDDKKINREYLYKAIKNVDRLNDIVDDLMLIAQYESGELELHYETFDLTKLIHEVFEALEMKADIRDIDLELKSGMERAMMVEADRKMISQVLDNLVNNSIKYGKEGGHTRVGYYDLHDNLLVEISDNGPGIPEEHLPRLFERFYRIDKSRSRDQGGTGLGLAIVKHIVEAHNQTINVRSQVGVGSTFGFTLKKA